KGVGALCPWNRLLQRERDRPFWFPHRNALHHLAAESAPARSASFVARGRAEATRPSSSTCAAALSESMTRAAQCGGHRRVFEFSIPPNARARRSQREQTPCPVSSSAPGRDGDGDDDHGGHDRGGRGS